MHDDTNMTVLQKMLDAAALRHRVIAHNLANANTPGYRRREVRFNEQLAAALQARDAERLAAVRPVVAESEEAATRPDGGNVTTERELADLMQNSLLYNACTQLLSSRIAAYRAAISGDSRTA
jgi:flagellar basal-body rod protein FlgB